MNHPLETEFSPTKLEAILADCLQRQERGEPIPVHQLIAQHPEHASQLRSFFANQQWLAPTADAPGLGDLAGEIIDDFALTRMIARGGMGVVYEATQLSLRRNVAIKLVGQGVLANDELRSRFRIEAEAAATLSHPNLLPIHSIGRWRGVDYFTMPLVTGQSLQSRVAARAARLASGSETVTETREHLQSILAIVRDIARGVAYAHRCGIIHRDLKPDNVLMDGDQPRIVDFGLAKWHHDRPQLTHDGQVLGTPHYMSPEQARGSPDITAATDIYSLGGILWSLLIGAPPHRGNSVAQVLASVLDAESPSLRLSWPGGMPRLSELGDIDTILSCAMMPLPLARYRTADDFADDLDRVLTGEAPQASPDGFVSRVTRELVRDSHPAAFANWGRVLRRIGIIVLMAHIAMFVIQLTFKTPSTEITAGSREALLGYFVPRIVMLAAIAHRIHRARDGMWLPQAAAERPIWSVWLGYLATLTLVNVLWWSGFFSHDEVMVLACINSGFAFLAMAGHAWGGNAFLGGAFFLAALLAARFPATAPLFVGGAWMLAMQVLGQRYATKT